MHVIGMHADCTFTVKTQSGAAFMFRATNVVMGAAQQCNTHALPSHTLPPPSQFKSQSGAAFMFRATNVVMGVRLALMLEGGDTALLFEVG